MAARVWTLDVTGLVVAGLVVPGLILAGIILAVAARGGGAAAARSGGTAAVRGGGASLVPLYTLQCNVEISQLEMLSYLLINLEKQNKNLVLKKSKKNNVFTFILALFLFQSSLKILAISLTHHLSNI